MGRGQHSSNRVSGISSRTIHQSTTPSLSQTIWPRWASRQFLTLPTVQTLLPVVMRQLRRWKRLCRRSMTCSYKRIYMGPSRNCWNGITKGDYFEGDKIFMCVLSIKVSIRKKSGNLFNDPHIYIIYIYIYTWVGWKIYYGKKFIWWHHINCWNFLTNGRQLLQYRWEPLQKAEYGGRRLKCYIRSDCA